MNKPEKLPAREMLLAFAEQLEGCSYQREIVKENYSLRAYKREGLGARSIAVDLQFSQIAMDWLQHLSKTAQIFIVSYLLPNIKMYNLLWHFPTPTKKTEKIAIKELVDKHIIFRTEVPSIYLINPTKLWRGTIFGAIEATRRLLFEHRRPSLEIIIDLKAPRSSQRTGEDEMILMNSNGMTPKLLDL
jgi:hypothetical protein